MRETIDWSHPEALHSVLLVTIAYYDQLNTSRTLCQVLVVCMLSNMP